ncbi:MAG: radical SAM/SPASM domain-containing protein [Thermoanaerobaculia bacterium]
MADLGWQYLTAADKRLILRGIRDGRAYGGPFHAEIHPADRCNLDCFFCSTATLRGTDEISPPSFSRLLTELKDGGTRSLRLSGGGEPLFHRNINAVFSQIIESGLPIENLTTNAVLLRDRVLDAVMECCDLVTVSLNTADPSGYASMMRSTERNFDRVVANVRELKRRSRSRRTAPRVNLQFLVWKGNYETIPKMYELARELEVDTIQFNGLAFLRPEERMTPEETERMLGLYEDLVRRDEWRRITGISSFEQDLTPWFESMSGRLARERAEGGLGARVRRYLTRSDFPLRERVRHSVRMRAMRRRDRQLADTSLYCLVAWHSLVIRTTGTVAPCCILQGTSMDEWTKSSIHDVWHGPQYQRLRQELSRIMREGESWEARPAGEELVSEGCLPAACPMSTFYFQSDVRFARAFSHLVEESRNTASPHS